MIFAEISCDDNTYSYCLHLTQNLGARAWTLPLKVIVHNYCPGHAQRVIHSKVLTRHSTATSPRNPRLRFQSVRYPGFPSFPSSLRCVNVCETVEPRLVARSLGTTVDRRTSTCRFVVVLFVGGVSRNKHVDFLELHRGPFFWTQYSPLSRGT